MGSGTESQVEDRSLLVNKGSEAKANSPTPPTIPRCFSCGESDQTALYVAVEWTGDGDYELQDAGDGEPIFECDSCIGKDVLKTIREHGRPFASYNDVLFGVRLTDELCENWVSYDEWKEEDTGN